MPKINVLSKEISELIAAGEVVERPASVIKELVENSIDAGAKHITVELERGGIVSMRITDDGCGISNGDVPLAFMRHATSKINCADDLYSIATLGFRGEALAATSSVSRVELFTKTKDEELGTHYKIVGGVEVLNEESGCPDGTTIIIRDLFYNTPARMKFLKKDTSEGNAAAAVVERAALSHPEIAFKLIRDGKVTLSSSGDGKLESAIYSVLGREFSKSLIPVNSSLERVGVTGFIVKPVYCKATRGGQYTFLNNRLVRSGTVTAAVEQAYKNSAMVGKFPAFVINVEVPFETVDVNVHPAKTEVRFSDEKRVFDAVYYAVKNAIATGDSRPVIDVATKPKATFARMTTEQYREQAQQIPLTPAERAYSDIAKKQSKLNSDNRPYFEREDVKRYVAEKKVPVDIYVDESEVVSKAPKTVSTKPKEVIKSEKEQAPTVPLVNEEDVKLVGEAFSTYIVVEKGSSLFLIDKHAAHERIIFNRLKEQEIPQTQALLTAATVRLESAELDAVLSNLDLLYKAGFEIEDFGNSAVLVRGVPASLTSEDIPSLIAEAADCLKVKGNVSIERLDNIFHTVACKAAIKAGSLNSTTELTALAKTVLSSDDVMYCPHGRPVAFEIKKKDLEKQFGRIQ